MRKAISILLAIAALSFGTSAFALNITNNSLTGYEGSVANFAGDDDVAMPCFRPGDTVHFTVGALSAETELMVLTYKYDYNSATTLSDSTVQYINQYTATANTYNVDYVVRDLDAGVYKLELRALNADGSYHNLQDFYYTVAKVTAESVTQATDPMNTSAWYVFDSSDGKYSIGYLGKVTLEAGNANDEVSGNVTLTEAGAAPGFSIKDSDIGNSSAKSYKFGSGDNQAVSALMDPAYEYDKYELNGTYTYVYGVTMYDVPSAKVGKIIATPITD